jgi:hypothetical protein
MPEPLLRIVFNRAKARQGHARKVSKGFGVALQHFLHLQSGSAGS